MDSKLISGERRRRHPRIASLFLSGSRNPTIIMSALGNEVEYYNCPNKDAKLKLL